MAVEEPSKYFRVVKISAGGTPPSQPSLWRNDPRTAPWQGKFSGPAQNLAALNK
jgi:hypothetical protein